MKREIKFRAWDVKNQTWIDINGLSIWFGLHPDSGSVYGVTEQGNLREYPINEVALMQYTGIKDRNGVEIYEGDIIKVASNAVATIIYFTPYAQFIGQQGNFLMDLNDGNRYEVIGNIYENPELLKGGSE